MTEAPEETLAALRDFLRTQAAPASTPSAAVASAG
jgi:hypothetical protein